MWDTIRAAPRKYFFSSSSSTKPSSWKSDSQSTLAPVYPEILSPQKPASTALAIPKQKPIFTRSELLQRIKEGISEFDLPPDPAGKNKENHPLFGAQHKPRIPTLLYLSEDNRLDDAATGNQVLSQLKIALSDSYSEYISNGRGEHEVGYPDEVNVTQKQNKNPDSVQSLRLERPPRRDTPLPTVLEPKTNIPMQSPPTLSPITPRVSSPIHRLRREHRREDSVSPPSGLSPRALYLKEEAQTRPISKSKSLSIISSAKTASPRHRSDQVLNYRSPTSSLQILAHPQAPICPPGRAQTLQGNLDQAPHPGHKLASVPTTEGEELPMTMAQRLALGKERVIAMCGFPDPPLMSKSPPHLNTPSPSTNLPLPAPLTPPRPARILQPSDTPPPPTFKVPRKPLPPRQISPLEDILSLTEEDFKSQEQIKMMKNKPLPPLPRSESTLTISSMRSSISGRWV
ncbi:hypothetical protein B9Z19DRAFT_1060650 [Tuber borchii]|uniref:Uncharacterized protein n=1 Tax=Tuber borchii TaxID=42251 RepID=A0A2T7A833_TUBBO|nr:hypothetical protein B9Z19DRAFT_1060650 [Tuber borchii]